MHKCTNKNIRVVDKMAAFELTLYIIVCSVIIILFRLSLFSLKCLSPVMYKVISNSERRKCHYLSARLSKSKTEF